ncbi:hypothetical protein JCM9279_004551 [Rhodotorula babjevae]
MVQGNPQSGKGGQRPPSGPSLAIRFNRTFSGPVGGSGGGNKDRPVPTGPASMSTSNGQSLASRMSSGAGPAATPPASSSSTKQPQHPSAVSKQVSLAQRLATSKPSPPPAPSAPSSRPPSAQATATSSSTSRPDSLDRSSSAAGGNSLAERLSQPAAPSSDNRGPARPTAQPARSGGAQQVEQPRPLAQRLDGPSAAPAASTSAPSPASSSGAPPRATSSALGTASQAPLAQRLSSADVSRHPPGPAARPAASRPRPAGDEAGTPPRPPPPRAFSAGTPPLQPAAMRAAAPAPAPTADVQQAAARERPRQAQQAPPQPRPAAQPAAPPSPRPAQQQQQQQQQMPPRPDLAATQAPPAARAAPPPTPLAARIKPEPPSPNSSHPSLAPPSSSTTTDVKPLLGRLGPLPHAAAPGASAPSSASAADLRTMKERADELRAAEARAAELRKLEAAEAAEAKEREERERRELEERREKERREADARREKEEREQEERKEKERRVAAEREKDKRREKERLEKERLEKELLEMERRRTDEMVEAARRDAEERAASMARQRALEEKREAERVRAQERAAAEAAAAAAAAEEERSAALRRAEERAVAELRAAEAELREAEARAAARRSSKERARSSAEGVQGAAGAYPDRTRETTAEGIARELELRRLVAERSRRAKSAARAVDPAGHVEMVDAAALSDPADGDYVMDEDDETQPRTASTPRTTTAPTWDAQVPPLQDPASYDWTQSSPIPALGALIARREDIFTKQRTFNKPELQRKSEDLIATKLATYARSGSYSGFGYKIGAYCSFCRAVDIPPWPASPPVFALFAHQVSYYATSSRAVLVTAFNMVHKVCRDLWDPLPVFQQLLEWPGAQAAVIEWKKQAPTTPAADGPAPRPEGAARVEGEGDEDSSAQSTTSKKKKKKQKQSATVPQHLCRGLPGVGATFRSTQAAHKKVAAAIVPVYGIGVDASHPSTIRCSRHGAGCPMRINLGLGGGRWRVLESSNFIHNHERDPNIVKDPTWRPYIRDAAAREAVEERDKANNDRTKSNPKKRDDNPGPDPPAPKKQARGPPTSSLPERPAFLPQPPRQTSTTVTAPALPDADVAATSDATSPSVEPAVPPPPPPPASTTASPAPPAPARRTGVTPSFQLAAPDPAAFLVDLTAFLSALDPALAPLARPLHSAGISTLRDLRAFVQFEPASRMALYEDLHSSGGPDAALLDVHLVERFEEALVAAQASGWR